MRLRFYRYLHRVTAPERTGVAWFDLIEFGLAAFGFLCYFVVRGGVVDDAGAALDNARWIIEVQQAFGVFIEPAVNQWVLESAGRVRFVNFVYFWLDFPLIVGIAIFFFIRTRRHYTILRDALLISGAFALIMYWTFPVAPPRYLPEWGFVDTLAEFDNLSYQAQSMRPFVNPFAAVPSLHVGWAIILAIVIFDATRAMWARIVICSVMVAQVVAVIGSANHFIFDAVVGAIVSLAGLGVAVWLQRGGYPRVRTWFQERAAAIERMRNVAH
jgi:hypothetical protein